MLVSIYYSCWMRRLDAPSSYPKLPTRGSSKKLYGIRPSKQNINQTQNKIKYTFSLNYVSNWCGMQSTWMLIFLLDVRFYLCDFKYKYCAYKFDYFLIQKISIKYKRRWHYLQFKHIYRSWRLWCLAKTLLMRPAQRIVIGLNDCANRSFHHPTKRKLNGSMKFSMNSYRIT